jgi:transcriptional regulator with XRE-family HTH domain
MTPRVRFSVNLRNARRAARISQQALGDRCGLHRTEISLLERGLREPRLGTLIKLSSALGVPPESLAAGMSWNVDKQRYEFKK